MSKASPETFHFTLDAIELLDASVQLGIAIVASCHDAMQSGEAVPDRQDVCSLGHCLSCGVTAHMHPLGLDEALHALFEDAQIYRLYPRVIADCFAPYSAAVREIWPEMEGHWASSAHHACMASILNFLHLVDPDGAHKHFDRLLREDEMSMASYAPTFFPDIPLADGKTKKAIRRLRPLPSFGDYAEKMVPWMDLELAKAQFASPRVRIAGSSETGPPARPKSGQSPRMTVDEANTKAMKLAHKMRAGFFALSERQQAEQIGCSWSTWKKTPLYEKAQAKRPGGKRQQPPSPKTESLTAGRESVTGEGDKDEVLENLIAEQEADKEPSPLESGPRKIHSRKRL